MIKKLLTLDDYIDAAREANGLTSDRQLDKMLSFKAPSSNHWRTGRALPSQGKMVELARLAGADEREALIQLDIWRAESRKEFAAAEVYKTILATLKNASKAAAVIGGITLFSVIATDAHARTNMGQSYLAPAHVEYYGKYCIFFL